MTGSTSDGSRPPQAWVAMVLALITVEGSSVWVDVLVYVTVAVTVYSGADYFFGFRALLAARPQRDLSGARRRG